MPYLNIDNSDIYYEVHGEGEPLVLAHGMGGNHAIWYQQLPVLAVSYQVIVFDHRGFGNSTDAEGLGRGAYVSDLKALLDHLQIDAASLIGQSMGGGTCVGFACRYPQRVRGLVIADSLHGLTEDDAVKTIMDQARQKTQSLGQIERVLGQQTREQHPQAACLYQQINSFNSVDRHNLKGHYEKLYSPQELATTEIPVMFIAGMDDILFPIEAIRQVQQATKGAFLVEIHNAGHSAFYENPTEFNDSLLSFLQMAGVKPTRRPRHSNSAGYQKPATA